MLAINDGMKSQKDEKQKDCHVGERAYGMFERSLSLSTEVDAGKFEAAFDKGVLTITMAKLPSTESKAQKIAVKACGLTGKGAERGTAFAPFLCLILSVTRA